MFRDFSILFSFSFTRAIEDIDTGAVFIRTTKWAHLSTTEVHSALNALRETKECLAMARYNVVREVHPVPQIYLDRFPCLSFRINRLMFAKLSILVLQKLPKTKILSSCKTKNNSQYHRQRRVRPMEFTRANYKVFIIISPQINHDISIILRDTFYGSFLWAIFSIKILFSRSFLHLIILNGNVLHHLANNHGNY